MIIWRFCYVIIGVVLDLHLPLFAAKLLKVKKITPIPYKIMSISVETLHLYNNEKYCK